MPECRLSPFGTSRSDSQLPAPLRKSFPLCAFISDLHVFSLVYRKWPFTATRQKLQLRRLAGVCRSEWRLCKLHSDGRSYLGRKSVCFCGFVKCLCRVVLKDTKQFLDRFYHRFEFLWIECKVTRPNSRYCPLNCSVDDQIAFLQAPCDADFRRRD